MSENLQQSKKALFRGPVKETRSIEKVENHLSIQEHIIFPNEHHAQHLKYLQNQEIHETFASCAKKSLKDTEKLIEKLPELYLEWDKLKVLFDATTQRCVRQKKTNQFFLLFNASLHSGIKQQNEYISKVHLTTSKDIRPNKRYDLIAGSLLVMLACAIFFLFTSNILCLVGFLAGLGYLFVEELGFGKDNFVLDPNPEIINMIQKVQPKVDEMYEILCHLYTWIRLHIPERSSGNNLYVEHQEDIGHQIHKCILYVSNLNFELNTFPYKEVYRLAKDYWRNKQDYHLFELNSLEKKYFRDRYSQILNCRDIIHETYDVLKKNFDKIKNPRGENEMSSDDDEPKQKNTPSYIS